jgi:hypothetical protein
MLSTIHSCFRGIAWFACVACGSSLTLAKNRLSGPALPGALLTLGSLRLLDLSGNKDLASTIPATVTVR